MENDNINIQNEPYSAELIAEYILYYYKNLKDKQISNLRLQKLLYFTNIYFLLENSEDENNLKPCFNDNIFAWNIGPTVAKVYYKYKNGIPDNIQNENLDQIKEEDKKKINKVIDYFKNISSQKLFEISINQKPWLNAYNSSDTQKIIDIKILYKSFKNDIKNNNILETISKTLSNTGDEKIQEKTKEKIEKIIEFLNVKELNIDNFYNYIDVLFSDVNDESFKDNLKKIPFNIIIDILKDKNLEQLKDIKNSIKFLSFDTNLSSQSKDKLEDTNKSLEREDINKLLERIELIIYMQEIAQTSLNNGDKLNTTLNDILERTDKLNESYTDMKNKSDELDKSYTDTKNKSDELDKSYTDIKNNIENIGKDYTSILGIFSGIVFVFISGIGFTGSILSNITKVPTIELLLISSFTAMILLFLISKLLYFLLGLNGKKEELKNIHRKLI